jgi:hypothetical protein
MTRFIFVCEHCWKDWSNRSFLFCLVCLVVSFGICVCSSRLVVQCSLCTCPFLVAELSPSVFVHGCVPMQVAMFFGVAFVFQVDIMATLASLA